MEFGAVFLESFSRTSWMRYSCSSSSSSCCCCSSSTICVRLEQALINVEVVGGLHREGDWNDDRQTRGCVAGL